ncbi:MAG: hypothetical protein PHE29_05045, partial [Tissierellia bacterium]|nr:hypothetical protein [Tissierellia bacterium]
MDTAGNETAHIVSYDKFDIEGPVIKYSLNPAADVKTKEPIIITIITSDKDEINSIGKCELYNLDENKLVSLDKKDEEFTATIDKSGRYAIYAWDDVGNKSTELFNVTNIDNSAVEMTKAIFQTPEVSYRLISSGSGFKFSTPEEMITGQTVDVIIDSFNKSNVTIYQVVPVEDTGLKESDIVYSMSSRSIRFKKNGSIAVSFVDEYGNVGHELITVDCIKTTPPQCKGVFSLSPNLGYATITFESIYDSGIPLEKDLSKIYLVSGILNSNAAVTAKEAEIIVNENKTYSFILSDEVGNTQNVSVTVTGIDKEPPKVTSVEWDYDYLKENTTTGEWDTLKEAGRDEDPPEEGYILSTESKLEETNQDVKVTVSTDKDIIQIGSFDNTPKRDITFVYHENGVFSFNLEAINETSVLYGVNVKLIDKNKPVIQFDNT